MAKYSKGKRACYGVTREELRDQFCVEPENALAYYVAGILSMNDEIARKKFGGVVSLKNQQRKLGSAVFLISIQNIFPAGLQTSAYHEANLSDHMESISDDSFLAEMFIKLLCSE